MTDGNALLEPIDLLLHQGSEAELQGFRRRVADDPLLALELADTVTLVERLRTLRVETSPEFSGKLADIVRRAERRLQPQSQRAPWLLAAAVAVVGFLLVSWTDPMGLRRPAVRPVATVLPPVAVPSPVRDVQLATVEELAHRDALEAMRRRFEVETATYLSAALETAMRDERELRDDLQGWLEPRNALAVLQLDHELRSHVDVRQRALRSENAMLAADQRAQALADSIADELMRVDLDQLAPETLALSLRALVSVGASTSRRRAALGAGTALLAQRLEGLIGADRIAALSALVEAATVEGLPARGLAAAGTALVDAVLLVDSETWQRRRPELLTSRVAPATIGDAGRTLALLPAFGVASDRCAFVRRLLLGQLRERRDLEQSDRPEVLAAMLYGFAELLSDGERDELVGQLRRWKPVHLAPDFVTVQQIAWGVEPGRSGFARLQRDMRQLVILPDPIGLGQRAALCLCLATTYAARRGESLERFMVGE